MHIRSSTLSMQPLGVTANTRARTRARPKDPSRRRPRGPTEAGPGEEATRRRARTSCEEAFCFAVGLTPDSADSSCIAIAIVRCRCRCTRRRSTRAVFDLQRSGVFLLRNAGRSGDEEVHSSFLACIRRRRQFDIGSDKCDDAHHRRSKRSYATIRMFSLCQWRGRFRCIKEKTLVPKATYTRA